MAEMYDFLGKDKEQLGLVSNSFEDQRESDDFLDFVDGIAADSSLSAPEKRAAVIKGMMDTPKYRNKLKYGIPAMFKEGLKNERGKDWKMSMKDIEKATGLTAKELLDPESGWMGSDKDKALSGEDLRHMLKAEDLTYADAVRVLSEAQSEADRKALWANEPWYSRAAMTAVAPLTSEDLSKGKPVDDIYTADYVGFGANVVPASRFIKVLGPIGRTAVDVALPSVAEGVTSVVADDVPLEEATKNTVKNIGAGGVATGALKSGAKGLGFVSGALDKSGKKAANITEDALKEGFYRADLDNRIKGIRKMIANGKRPSAEDIELLESFDMLKEMGIDLSKMGTFSKSKLQSYLNDLKRDPLKRTEALREAGKLGPEETLFSRREAIKASLDPYEQFKFDQNPGKVTFTDLALESDRPMKVYDYGWAPKAGFGKARKKVEGASLEGHEGITGAERPSFMSQINAGQRAGLAHTDPYYPRTIDVNKAAEELMAKYPQLKLYFSKMYNDPTRRDYLLNQVIPNMYWRLQIDQKTEPEKKEDKE